MNRYNRLNPMKNCFRPSRRLCAVFISTFALLSSSVVFAQNALLPTTTSLSAATNAPLAGASDVITITVRPTNQTSATPTGSVAIVVDSTSAGSPIALANGTATYTFSANSGSHVITAYYSGDQTFATSTGTITIAIAQKSFVINASSLTVAVGSSGVSTITITPLNGYTGTISFTLGSNSSAQIPCFIAPDATISGTAPVNVSMTLFTKSSGCPKSGALRRDKHDLVSASLHSAQDPDSLPGSPVLMLTVLGVAFLGMIACVAQRSKRSWWPAVCLLAIIAIAAGCGSSSSDIPAGTYSLTVSAVDKPANVAASSNFVLTVQ
jgi:hypothetical protein